MIVSIFAGAGIGIVMTKRAQRNFIEEIREEKQLGRPFAGLRKGALVARKRGLAIALGKVSKELNLSQQQKEEAKKILGEARQSVVSAKGNFQTELKKIRKDAEAKLESILSVEQQQRFKELLAKRRVMQG
jgi:hypothetical protein